LIKYHSGLKVILLIRTFILSTKILKIEVIELWIHIAFTKTKKQYNTPFSCSQSNYLEEWQRFYDKEDWFISENVGTYYLILAVNKSQSVILLGKTKNAHEK